MKRFLIFLFGLILFPCISFASGRMIVGTGENIILRAQSDIPSPEYKWVILQKGTIITTIQGENFTYAFNTAGEYIVNLVAESSVTHAVENSSIEIMVGKSQKFADSLNIELQSFPEALSDIISLPPKYTKTAFILSNSKGDIKEFRIDADTHKDSDNDGDPENDIDNIDTPSFHNGTLWNYDYAQSSLPTNAKITLVDQNKQKIEKLISIQAGALPSIQKLQAVIDTAPSVSDDKKIHLHGDKETVYVYPKNSLGEILEYRIDTDIATDSDGDGNLANDIDNLRHASFHTGETFPIEMNRTDGDKVIQLIVVSKNGKGSLIQRKIVWDSDTKLVENGEFRLVVDNNTPYAGESVHFGLEGLDPKENYEIKWDFNGDKTSDFESNTSTASYIYQQAGTYSAFVQIKNTEKRILKYATLPIQVQLKTQGNFSTKAPISNFSFNINGGTVQFTNTSTIDPSIKKDKVVYEWKFGDGLKSKEAQPKHNYQKTGTYIIRLKVSDPSGQFHEKQAIVEIQNISAPSSSKEEANVQKTEEKKIEKTTEKTLNSQKKTNTSTSHESSIGSFFLYIFEGIMLIFLFGLLGIFLYLIVQKIKNPDYTFGEIMDEEKEKILSILEGRSYEPPHGEIVATEKSVNEDVKEILKESEKAEQIKKDLSSKEAETIVQTPTQSIVTEVATTPIENAAPSTENSSNTLVPDWMKEDTIATTTSQTSSETEEIPDWLKDDSALTPSTPPQPSDLQNPSATTSPAPAADDDEDIPDWLK